MGKIRPYLTVENAVEALKTYETVFNAKINQRMPVEAEQAENFGLSQDDDLENRTLHAEFEVVGDAIYISDNFTGNETEHPNVTIMIEPDSLEQMKSIYEKVVEHKWKIAMELQQQFWGDYYCDFTDPYGIHWAMNFSPNQE